MLDVDGGKAMFLWGLRIGLIWVGNKMTGMGYGDAALWGDVVGNAIALAGTGWSLAAFIKGQRARKGA